ncbi:MAG TPA: hypothetical protein VLE50_00085 [Cellvibrio sp.]|nr:hypothetical protein [Cellvibrio sp.]
MSALELLAVIEVPETKPVLCQAQHCGRSVFRAVHVVQVGDDLRIYGSECAKQLLGFTGAKGRSDRTEVVTGDLSERDVDLLNENTAALIDELRRRFEKTQPQKNRAVDPKTLTRAQLKTYCLNIVKERFRAEKGVNPEQPGWLGWVNREARDLMDEILRNKE